MNYSTISFIEENYIPELKHLFSLQWWSTDRELDDIKQMLDHTDVLIGVLDVDSEKLIGFGRVLTDYVYKALLLDVMIHPDYQQKGLGRLLLDNILHHPSIKNVAHVELYCRQEMKPLYEKWGFTEQLGDLCFMRRPC
ncbi:GNAT family N-acetyltransferase [Falsibacillus albus]|uniref:GNAT family N-acetyltransferase n=1 Tax=Falsibacillus albus TaxID=2478915 RepID=UPI0011E5C72A|nr:GNAT family N-acetyltransferase [Falsibacillus albus]